MLEQGKLSFLQTLFLLINVVGATGIMFLPAITTHIAGRDAWISSVIAGLFGVCLILVLSNLGNRFPHSTLFEYLESILGKWPGKFVGVIYLFFLFHSSGNIINEFNSIFTSTIMMHTPPIIFNATILLICAYAIRGGLEVLARAFEVASYAIIFFLLIIFPVITFTADFNNLLPMLENGFMPVIRSSLSPIGWQGEIFLLAILMPYMKKPSQARRCGIIAVFITVIILTANTMLSIANFGETITKHVFPTFSMIRASSPFPLDAIILVFWVFGFFGKIGLLYYAAVLGCAQIANLRDYRAVILPTGVVLAALSNYNVKNLAELTAFTAKVLPGFLFFIEYIIPSLILVAALIRGSQSPDPG